eukprot:gb/GECG01009237.1/.p1 GENE.gb/GECG01009237.1/~~gb/GECG01009237.1/.p1  ORF type:complete len:280 (+),score=23.87 gb/GECG01009237.1/:1-840(+)
MRHYSKFSNSNMPLYSRYQLRSVVRHHGSSVDNGHYTSLVRRERHTSWYLLDDTNISIYPAHKVLKDPLAYILFYERLPEKFLPPVSEHSTEDGNGAIINGVQDIAALSVPDAHVTTTDNTITSGALTSVPQTHAPKSDQCPQHQKVEGQRKPCGENTPTVTTDYEEIEGETTTTSGTNVHPTSATVVQTTNTPREEFLKRFESSSRSFQTAVADVYDTLREEKRVWHSVIVDAIESYLQKHSHLTGLRRAINQKPSAFPKGFFCPLKNSETLKKTRDA